ncbi:hypothetical protein C0Q70_09951 [Pomacea canaliculata]|uniref:Uncharacterized protein n=1 Tax=Pomacea canaliculata TaxID=400727 RepID=A0A2T7PB79_POMCA|nr:hypothetical protein C0Q70_09951 [Pomacea canaliculata]
MDCSNCLEQTAQSDHLDNSAVALGANTEGNTGMILYHMLHSSHIATFLNVVTSVSVVTSPEEVTEKQTSLSGRCVRHSLLHHCWRQHCWPRQQLHQTAPPVPKRPLGPASAELNVCELSMLLLTKLRCALGEGQVLPRSTPNPQNN